MRLSDYLDDFCKQHGYTYSLDYIGEWKGKRNIYNEQGRIARIE